MRTQKEILSRIEMSLDTMRPYLQNDGGNVEIVEFVDSVLKVKLVGACENCPQSYMTMKAGIEGAVKQSVPEVKSVIAV